MALSGYIIGSRVFFSPIYIAVAEGIEIDSTGVGTTFIVVEALTPEEALAVIVAEPRAFAVILPLASTAIHDGDEL